MALTRENALKMAKDQLDCTNSVRAATEAYCGLMLAYAYGNQWAATKQNGNRLEMNTLKPIIDPNSTDIRVTMNLVRANCAKINSKLKPQALRFGVIPASRASNDQVSAMVADAKLQQQVKQSGGLKQLRRMSLWRVVMGSVIVARTLTQGPRITVRNGDGTPMLGADGQPQFLPTFNHDWSICPIYEFVRDPAANSTDFAGEDIIGRERPVTVEWLRRNFGEIVPKDFQSRSTMGELLEFQRYLYGATGTTLDSSWSNSKAPAVMASEWFFRDDENDKRRRWPWYLLAWRDTKNEIASFRDLNPLWFDDNPFFELPYHHFTYEEELLKPWARGVVSQCIQGQDLTNLAFTAMLRSLLTHSATKYLMENESLIENPKVAFSNRTNVPIIYRRGAAKPDRLPPAPMDQTVTAIIQSTPTWMNWLLNTAPVQYGQAVARGEAAKAYEIRRDAADTNLNAINDDDEITLNEMLTGTLFDIVHTSPTDSLVEELSGEFTPTQIETLKQQDIESSISGVQVIPDSLRPKTPEEMQADAERAIQSGMVDAKAARRTMFLKGRISLDERETRAFRQQTLEIQSILRGEVVDVAIGQDHETHMYCLDLETESPRWTSGGYSQEQKQALMAHRYAHIEAIRQNQAMLNPQPQNYPAAQDMAPEGAMPSAAGMTPDLEGSGTPEAGMALVNE